MEFGTQMNAAGRGWGLEERGQGPGARRRGPVAASHSPIMSHRRVLPDPCSQSVSVRVCPWLRALLCVAAASLLLSAAFAEAPMPEYVGRINDFANVIDQANRQRIAQVISDLEAQTTAEMAVVTVNSLQGEDIEGYANRLFNKWGIGKKGKDNGILLLVAVADHKLRIEVGYGLEGTIPDGLAGDIIRNTIVPYLKQGRFGDGIYAGALRVAQKVEGEEASAPAGGATTGQPAPPYVPAQRTGWPSAAIPGIMVGGFAFLFILVVIGIFVAVGVALYRAGRRCPKCRQQMQVEEEVLRQPTLWRNGRRRRERTCPACGFHDVHTYTIPRRGGFYASGGGWSSGGGWRTGGWSGGGGGGFSGGGGGGFGGGSSGGGGASGSW